MLQGIGVTAADERIYRRLLDVGRGTSDELAAVEGGDPTQVASALSRLRDLGLVSTLTGTPSRYVPSPPGVAIEVLVAEQEGRLAEARRNARLLDEAYRPTPSQDPHELIEILSGPAVGQRFQQLQRSARTEVMILDQPPYANATDNVPEQSAVLQTGLRWRAIYSPEALATDGQLTAIRKLVANGEEARTLPELPMKLVIVDHRVAMIPLSMDQAARSTAIVHRSTLLDALATLFENLWRRALPLWEGSMEADRADDILRLLAAGFTDAAIARRLDISTRTVRRRVASMLDQLDAGSRFQAGVQAARRGWL